MVEHSTYLPIITQTRESRVSLILVQAYESYFGLLKKFENENNWFDEAPLRTNQSSKRKG
jgi:hypothetical protein